MPYAIKKVKGGYSVVNKDTGAKHSKHSSLANAQAQMRLLHGVEHGWHPSHSGKHGTMSVRNWG